MQKFLIATLLSATALTAMTIQADANGRWRGHHRNRTVIIEQQPVINPLLGLFVASQLFAQPAPQERFYEPEPSYKDAPPLRRSRPIPLK